MSERAMRVKWSDIARAARETSESLAGKDWGVASIRARVLLADLADEVDRLRGERDSLLEALRDVVAISDRKHDAWDRAKAAIAGATGEGTPPPPTPGPPAPPTDAEVDARIERRLATLREDVGRMREARERDPSARPTPPF